MRQMSTRTRIIIGVVIVLVIAAAVFFTRWDSEKRELAFSGGFAFTSYKDECIEESCDGEEVNEFWDAYHEECISEAPCSDNEVRMFADSNTFNPAQPNDDFEEPAEQGNHEPAMRIISRMFTDFSNRGHTPDQWAAYDRDCWQQGDPTETDCWRQER